MGRGVGIGWWWRAPVVLAALTGLAGGPLAPASGSLRAASAAAPSPVATALTTGTAMAKVARTDPPPAAPLPTFDGPAVAAATAPTPEEAAASPATDAVAAASATPAPAPAALGTGIWSVVIGVDDYPGHRNDLQSAGNDAGELELLLDRAGAPPEQRLHLVDGQATADAIRQAVDWLVARAGPDATAVFFFAGHVRELAPGVEAMVAADGRLVADHELALHLDGLRARQTWIVFAACFGGGFDEVLAPGRILTAAAPAGRLAYESLELRRSYLVEYLVRRALLEGRAGTVESAFAWADAAIRDEHPGRAPVQYDHLDGDLELRPASLPAAQRPTPPPPRPPAPPTPAPRPVAAPPPPPPGTPPTAGEEESCGVGAGALLGCLLG